MAGGCITGAAVGAIIVGNVGGAMLGGILGTAIGIFVDQYSERKITEREEALLKHPLKDSQENLIVEDYTTNSQYVSPGAKAHVNIHYTILSASSSDSVEITEIRVLFTEKEGFIPLAKRTISRSQGTYSSVFTFRVPEGISHGNAVLITTISYGTQKATAQTPLKIL